jgi:hypothetical protein
VLVFIVPVVRSTERNNFALEAPPPEAVRGMLFHFDLYDGRLIGWVLPDNPSAMPRIKISGPGASFIELEANSLRTDLRDSGYHETGMAGFVIDDKVFPYLSEVIDEIEIRESESNTLVYRRFQPGGHLPIKLLRLELRAMPDPETENLFAKHFALYYGAAQRYPQDTLFGILNNSAIKSIYVSGHPNYQQYEQVLRDREYKIIMLIRNPYEEMAERLLFARYASNPNAPAFVADHMYGLGPLKEMVKDVKFDDIGSLRAAFNAMTDPQKQTLNNPLVRALACSLDERPKAAHVEIALSKLSRMDLVGLRNRFGEFKSILPELLGVDVFGNHELTNLSWVTQIVEQLSDIKQVRNLIALDLDLYSFAEEAVTEALGTTIEEHSLNL